MLPEFEQNAAFIWAIFAIGLVVPALLGVYAGLKARLARRRLARLTEGDLK
ncbi:hypothetical protein [Henriciella sp.]|uniref:hypothetical protein n=1 Tax=Henriciella sp. TaxID=1968823 RepID=UPI002636C277|nr:hypothetical protein [Henriciella sp.]